jgi:hypothetical protein
MSAARVPRLVRWNVEGSAFTPSVLECEPTSLMMPARSCGGSRYSLFGTVLEWAEATKRTGVPVSFVSVAVELAVAVSVAFALSAVPAALTDRSTKTCSTSQSCQWKLVVN